MTSSQFMNKIMTLFYIYNHVPLINNNNNNGHLYCAGVRQV